MATLKAERRPGRPSSNREDLLKQKIATEDREFDTGFWIPDMHDVANRKQLQIWNGEWSALNTLRFVRVTRTGEIKESSFPPSKFSNPRIVLLQEAYTHMFFVLANIFYSTRGPVMIGNTLRIIKNNPRRQ